MGSLPFCVLLSVCALLISAPPWGFYPVVWVALVPWLVALDRSKSLWQAFGVSVSFSVLWVAVAFWWLVPAIHDSARFPWWLSVSIFLVYLPFAQLQLVGTGLLLWRFKHLIYRTDSPAKRLWGICSVGFFYCAFEGVFPKLFADTLGHTFYTTTYLRQVVDLGGVPLLTWLILVINVTIAGLVIQPPNEIRHLTRRWEIALSLLLLSGYWMYGYFRVRTIQAQLNSVPTLDVLALQGNISKKGQKFRTIGKTYLGLTSHELRNQPLPQLLIWPETVNSSLAGRLKPGDPYLSEPFWQQLAKTVACPVLLGSELFTATTDVAGNKMTLLKRNSMVLMTPRNGKVQDDAIQIYFKSILFPMTETAPGWIPASWLKRIAPRFSAIRPAAQDTGTLQLIVRGERTVSIDPLICYESLFPKALRKRPVKRSDLLVNIVEDGWFGYWGGPQLHYAVSTFRAIETRRSMVRLANVGISGIFLPDGSIPQTVPLAERGFLRYRVPLGISAPTFYERHGEWVHWVSIVMLIIFSGFYRGRMKTAQKS